MSNTKKCSNCGEWSHWNLSLDDKCEHCGEYLQKQEKEKAEEKAVIKQLQEKAFLFHINENDNIFQKILKKGGYAVYLIILAIVSFLSWILFWLGP